MTDTPAENVATSEEAQAATEPTELTINVHPVADLFPLLEGEELDALAEDIKAKGLREPIKRHNGMLIDGRNRTNACKLAGVEPRFENMTFASEAEVAAYIISLNIHRRHLDTSQRGLIAAQIANMQQGERTDLEPSANLQKVSQSDAAGMMNVSVRSVASAKEVLDHCDQETIKRVRDGKESLHKAASKAKAAKLSTGGKSNLPQASAKRTKDGKNAHDLKRLNQAWNAVLAIWNEAGFSTRKEFLRRVAQDTHSNILFANEVYKPDPISASRSETKLLPAPEGASHEASTANVSQ